MLLIDQSAAWRKLAEHKKAVEQVHLRDALNDSARCQSLYREFDGIGVDYSRQRVNNETMSFLFELAEAAKVKEMVQSMAAGDRVNISEDRAVMHIALRANDTDKYTVDGTNVVPEVRAVIAKINAFSSKVRSGEWRGATGKPLTNVIAIGIGGSYLGANFVYEALRCDASASSAAKGRNLSFLANVDPVGFTRAVEGFDPETTLAIIISKTFTTRETMLNARTVKQWFIRSLGAESISKHMVACSTNLEAVEKFGINPENAFAFWDWVGGRYSVTSAVGLLPLTLHFGEEQVSRFLAGARSIDRHFIETPYDQNLPVILGMLGIWNRNFWNHASRALACYSESLLKFAPHIQQVDMESNGKRVTKDGQTVTYATGPINFGEPGTNAQHSFFQLFHQGEIVPVDFIGFAHSQTPIHEQGEEVSNHDELMANFFAQPDALATGKTAEQLKAEGVAEDLIPHRLFPGNRPSTVMLLNELTAYQVGQLLALYEHRTVVEGAVWGIDSFDQWGVELGKILANKVRSQFVESRKSDKAEIKGFNPSTTHLLQKYVNAKSASNVSSKL